MAAYTTIDKPSDFFNTVLYAGTGSENTISGVGFQPDWTWLKSRSNTQPHVVSDSVRGAAKQLYTADTQAETSYSQYVKSFNSDGFVLGTDSQINQNSQTFVSWNWKAGTSFTNDASSTSIGTIDSNGSVSSDAGFGIVKWSGTGSAGTIAHNMGSTPSFLIIKRLSDANWLVQATSLGYGNYLALNTTGASASASTLVTGVSSTLVTLGDNGSVNGSGQDYIGYFFSEKQGYSKIGSYTGNGASGGDGTFSFCGFKPAWVMIKRTDSTANWQIWDNKRLGYNPDNNALYPNLTNSEDTSNTIDFLSNGFKQRGSGHSNYNASGANYIFMAFAENPFVTSTGVPATAR